MKKMGRISRKKQRRKEYFLTLVVTLFLFLLLCTVIGALAMVFVRHRKAAEGGLDGTASQTAKAAAPAWKQTADGTQAEEESLFTAEKGVLPKEERLSDQVEDYLSHMTLDQKIYQMFIVTPEQLTGVATVTAAGGATKSKLEQYPVGGLIYFASNLVSRQQTQEMLSNIQNYANEISKLPLFLCVDEEGGRVARIGKNSSFGVDIVGPMAEVSSQEEAYRCGETIGSYLHELGFNVDFAPDADVVTNSSNTVIGDRSFGADADLVTDYAVAYSDGLHSQGILSTFKHFPGHGATEADTHEGYAYTTKSYEQLKEAELKPFMEAEKQDVDMIMIAHISVPNVTGDDLPCSLSHKMVTDILRKDLKYNGLAVTDALNMGAVSEKYSSGEAAVRAVKAGVDLLLMPVDLGDAYAGISHAVKTGEISEERIDESLRRILSAKLSLQAGQPFVYSGE